MSRSIFRIAMLMALGLAAAAPLHAQLAGPIRRAPRAWVAPTDRLMYRAGPRRQLRRQLRHRAFMRAERVHRVRALRGWRMHQRRQWRVR